MGSRAGDWFKLYEFDGIDEETDSNEVDPADIELSPKERKRLEKIQKKKEKED